MLEQFIRTNDNLKASAYPESFPHDLRNPLHCQVVEETNIIKRQLVSRPAQQGLELIKILFLYFIYIDPRTGRRILAAFLYRSAFFCFFSGSFELLKSFSKLFESFSKPRLSAPFMTCLQALSIIPHSMPASTSLLKSTSQFTMLWKKSDHPQWVQFYNLMPKYRRNCASGWVWDMGWWSLTKPDLRVTGPMLSVHLNTLHQHDAGQTVRGKMDTFF